ncbi:phosphotransferase family protein [Hyalangium rubrum]|uniref:Phosphotransferase family protein n=1 Tax=Hyalangium rubrum TaxID=3103134 RepID=A0ABU5HES5_9BACT|nr:phosphotransferase family protein [Hyalangium sp. s54d21]MDY7231751.1 phosphotransferase family protein [Hyalangium sp. s54d21]
MSDPSPLDRAGAVRPGEELDITAVDAWLKPRVPGLSGTPKVTQYSGGASNWTYRLEYEQDDLILRRPPAGTKAKSAHDMGREFQVQQALRPVYPYVPEMLARCEDPSVIGSEFYVMRRIPGIIPRKHLPKGLGLDPQTTRKLCLNVIDKLVELHQVDVKRTGLEHLGKGTGYARRQIEGWSARYEKARTWNVPRFHGVISWLKANTPEDVATCVIHNDFRLDNLVLAPEDPTRVIGILDWEMATLGDPLMDLGNSLAYWVQADDDLFMRSMRRQPTHLPGMLTRREVVDYYCERMGLKPANMAFYEVYGLFRLAVIVQQIYYRYHHRQTRNPAFKRFWLMAHYLHWRCRRLIR